MPAAAHALRAARPREPEESSLRAASALPGGVRSGVGVNMVQSQESRRNSGGNEAGVYSSVTNPNTSHHATSTRQQDKP